ncbi:MAG: ABC transporter ATP-binding protein [Rhizobiaceae bacterium]|nr:ABC transporter ATP-binding protein [Rhizobiaceae bacterium]
MASHIAVENICTRYGDVEILSDISLDIKPGEVLSLLGPSGSGKTTLLRIIAGLEHPCGGKVSIDGRTMSDTGVFVVPEKRGIGLVFQDYALFPHLTVLGNVKFGLDALPGAEADEQARRILSRVGLLRYQHSYPHQLSGGEQQRVALARALAPRPGILLMDEPFSGLDARMRDAIREETIELLRDTRSTVIIVTHDPEEALRVSDRIALMKDGKIIQTGSCNELYYSPKSRFAAEFFTELNIFHASVKDEKINTPFGQVKADGLAQGAKVVACVRLSDIHVETSLSKKRRKTDYTQRVLGQVVKRRFMGIVELLEVYLPGHEEPIKVRVNAGLLPKELNMVSISTNLSAIMLFEDK